MSETKEEYLVGQFLSRRRDFLRDMDIGELMDLFPEVTDIKELLIEEIINNVWDKQINDEVKWWQKNNYLSWQMYSSSRMGFIT